MKTLILIGAVAVIFMALWMLVGKLDSESPDEKIYQNAHHKKAHKKIVSKG